ncbi:MAG: tripartite tricarboxylate transporter substrate binding protein [Patescibacteria group bacterium]
MLWRLLLVVAVSAIPVSASAEYPDKPVKIIVSTTGAAIDLVTRMVGEKLGEKLGTKVVVQSYPGAGGLIALTEAVLARPDGYTFVVGTNSLMIGGPLVSKDPGRWPSNLVPVGVMGQFDLAVSTSIKEVKNLGDLKAYSKTHKLFGIASGITGQVCLSALAQGIGIQINLVQYRNLGDAMIDFIRGDVHLSCAAVASFAGRVKAEELQLLAIIGRKRNSLFPDTPTMDELKIKTFEGTFFWYGLFAPPQTPDAIIIQVNQALCAALGDEQLRALLEGQGVEAACSTPERLGEILEFQKSRWRKIVNDSGLVK